jgi:hypothetical protein
MRPLLVVVVLLALAGTASARVAPLDPEPMAPYSPPVPADVQARLADRNVTVSYQAVPLGSYIKAPRAIDVAARETPACSEPGPTSAHLVSFYGGGFVQPPDLAWLVVEKNVCEWIFGGIGDGGFYDADMAVFVDARTGDWLGALSL